MGVKMPEYFKVTASGLDAEAYVHNWYRDWSVDDLASGDIVRRGNLWGLVTVSSGFNINKDGVASVVQHGAHRVKVSGAAASVGAYVYISDADSDGKATLTTVAADGTGIAGVLLTDKTAGAGVEAIVKFNEVVLPKAA